MQYVERGASVSVCVLVRLSLCLLAEEQPPATPTAKTAAIRTAVTLTVSIYEPQRI
jgi:hypothetical protein